MKMISVVIPCYNEEENVQRLYDALSSILSSETEYNYEILFIDNNSNDRTVEILKKLAVEDSKLKLIVNSRNFGTVRSPTHGMWSASGDVVIVMAADFQDPPEMIPTFIRGWESGYKVVVAVKEESAENKWLFGVRKLYYRMVNRLSEVPLIENFTGYGLYDRLVIDTIKSINDPYPYFRGLVSEVGYETKFISYSQPRRSGGVTKNNFFTLYDMAMNGITSHSKLPLRLVTLLGFIFSLIGILAGVFYGFYKLFFWDQFEVGIAPLVIGQFIFNGVIFFILGFLGEYIGFINTRILNRPLVVEKERVNFDIEEERENKLF